MNQFQIAIVAALVFVGGAIVYATHKLTPLIDGVERITPAAESVGAALSPKRVRSTTEVPMTDASQTRKITAITTVQASTEIDYDSLPVESKIEIESLRNANYTTKQLWENKREQLKSAQEELDRRLDVLHRQKQAIKDPFPTQDPAKLKIGLISLTQGVEQQQSVIRAITGEMSALQRTLDQRTQRIKAILEGN